MKSIRGVSETKLYKPLFKDEHAAIFCSPTPWSFDADEHTSLLLPNMSVRKFLLMALVGALLTQSVSSQVSCNDRLDHDCCKDKNGEKCTFTQLGTDFEGACLDNKVSSLVNSCKLRPTIRHSSAITDS
jgi:hypothetical protein